ncbi:MAG: HEAT repeat domain-containing protein [Myxococcales bacterium]
MTTIWIYLGLIGLAACLWLLSRFRLQSNPELWRDAAQQLKLQFVSTRFQKPRIVGFVDRQTVEIEGYAEGDDAPKTRFRLKSHGQISPRLSLVPSTALAFVAAVPPADHVPTGDEAFDRHVHASGPTDVALAPLDAEARARVLDFAVRLKGVVKAGELTVELDQAVTAKDVVEVARAMLEVAELLRVTSVPDALCHNAEHDPVARVRQNNLLALAKHHQAQVGHVERLAQRATSDSDPNVMLSAVAHLLEPRKGREALEKVVADPAAPEQTRKKALEFALAKFAWADCEPILTGALDRKVPGLALMAVEAIGSHRDQRFVDALSRLSVAKDEGLAKSVAETLGKLRDPRGETALLRLLERDELQVRRAAVAALARAGTARAVEPLLPLTKGFLADPQIKDEAQEAIRWIQGRIGSGLDSGGLSVVQADEREGNLSLVPAPPSRKSDKGS